MDAFVLQKYFIPLRSYSRVHVQLVLPTRAGGEVVVPAEDGFRRRYVTAGRDGVVKVQPQISPHLWPRRAGASILPWKNFRRFVRRCGIREKKKVIVLASFFA